MSLIQIIANCYILTVFLALHSIPIIKMGDYTARMAAMQVFRDPFDDEEAAHQKERNIFGNRYRRMEKTLKIDEQDEDRGIEYHETMKDIRQCQSHQSPRISSRRLSSASSEGSLSSFHLSSALSLLPPLCVWHDGIVVTPIPKVLYWEYARSDESSARKYYANLADKATKRFKNIHTAESTIKEELCDISSMSDVVDIQPFSLENNEIVSGEDSAGIINSDVANENSIIGRDNVGADLTITPEDICIFKPDINENVVRDGIVPALHHLCSLSFLLNLPYVRYLEASPKLYT